MTRAEVAEVMVKVFEECSFLRDAGQKEYARAEENAFANFERVAERLGLDRKQVLMVYAEKHIDGIHSFIKGHESQREDVRGRINDLIVYMCLLRGMIDEEKRRPTRTTSGLAQATIEQGQALREASPQRLDD